MVDSENRHRRNHLPPGVRNAQLLSLMIRITLHLRRNFGHGIGDMTMTSTLDEAKHHVRHRLIGSLGASPARVRVALILVVFGFITLASVVAVKTPPWQSSDEPEHVRNIETLVSGHWYGMNGDCRPNLSRVGLLSCAGDEAQQAPLYYMVLAAWQDFVGLPAEPPPQIIRTKDFSCGYDLPTSSWAPRPW